MQKIAVFGKPGSGKSRLAKRLAVKMGIEYCPIDEMHYKANGDQLSKAEFGQKHESALAKPQWIMDGLGTLSSFEARIQAADTLIYIDLPYRVSYWFVVKRFIKGLFVTPDGWPKGSSIVKGTIASFQFLKLSKTFWNQAFTEKLLAMQGTKNVFIIKTRKQLDDFNLK